MLRDLANRRHANLQPAIKLAWLHYTTVTMSLSYKTCLDLIGEAFDLQVQH